MRVGRRTFWIRGPRQWFRKPRAELRRLRTREYTVRSGIMQRVLVRELASALESKARLSDGSLAAWAQGLPSVEPPYFGDSASRMRLVLQPPQDGLFRRGQSPRSFRRKPPWTRWRKPPWSSISRAEGQSLVVGDSESSSFGVVAPGGHASSDVGAPGGGATSDADAFSDVARSPCDGAHGGNALPEGDWRGIVERHADRVAAWCERALEAGGEVELARIVETALSDATVSYAFGSYEEEISIDDLCGDGPRSRLDRIAERLIRLPGLEWWSEDFDPAVYTWHETVPASRTPTGSGPTWFPSSEMDWQVLFSYRDLPASRFDPDRWEDSVVDGHTCTEQWFGDDAGDCDVARLDRGSLAGAEGARIVPIHKPEDWTRLVARFPARLAPEVKAEWQGDAEGQMYTVDWQAARREVDGVYISVAGAIRSAYAPLALEDVVGDSHSRPLTMMTGWTPGSVLWLNPPRVF